MTIAIALLLTLILAPVTAAAEVQEPEPVLGRPSTIRPTEPRSEILEIDTTVRLHEAPGFDAPVLEILHGPLELPILDRRGPWVQVRFGNWQGWIFQGDESARPDRQLPLSIGPDEQRLLRARTLLSPGVEPRRLGPFTLYTDVTDSGLLSWLSAVAQDVVRAYRERFALDPGADVRAVLVIFADESDYRRFESAETRVARTESRGYTTEGLSVLFTGDQDRVSQVSVFIHELTHLLNRRVFRSELPPWLEEGLAEDLAFSQVTPKGEIRLGTLAGTPRSGSDDRFSLSEPRAHLAALASSLSDSDRPALAALAAMDWQDFIQPDRRALHYAASAMLVRYLLTGSDAALSQSFLRYLDAVRWVDLAESVSVWQVLGRGPEEIEDDWLRFVSREARTHGLR